MFRIFWVFFVATSLVVLGLWFFAPVHYIEYVSILSGSGYAGPVLKTIGMNRSIGMITWIIADFAHGLFYGVAASGLGFIMAYAIFRYAITVENREVESRSSVVLDKIGGPESAYVAVELKFYSMKTAFNLSDQSIKLQKYRGKIKVPGWATPYEIELLSILFEHRDWPSDVSDYHGTNLYEHSVSVWKYVAKTMKNNNIDPKSPTAQISRCLALTHDAGKILAYKKRDGAWEKISNRHEQLGPVVMRSIGSFWSMDAEVRKGLEKSAAILLNGDNPVITGVAVDTAVKAVRAADMFVTNKECMAHPDKPKEPGAAFNTSQAPNAVQHIDPQLIGRIFDSSIDTLIEKLKIGKNSGSKKAQINIEYKNMVFIDAITFVSHIIDSAETSGILGLQRPTSSVLSKDAKMILEALTKGGQLITKIKGKETGDLGLFSFKTSKVNLFNVVCIEWKWPQYIVDNQTENVVECAVKPV
ncbi:hypothetical protein [Acidithiobacillus sp.]|uniref:hypothetical protein n=1 Tax=Acidithiobacillus sp. TaxID=1872118 RepID=UPI00262B32B2|nr:hypothetical protein [Acidithiobacillus sp.]MDD5278661.1 hypothetical protein [Acidithiobacillus sp.]